MKSLQLFKAYWLCNAPTGLTFNNCMLCPHCIYVFCIYLRTYSDLCHLQHKLIGFYSRDEKCLQRVMDWGFKQSSLRFVFKGLTHTWAYYSCISYIFTNVYCKEVSVIHTFPALTSSYQLLWSFFPHFLPTDVVGIKSSISDISYRKRNQSYK